MKRPAKVQLPPVWKHLLARELLACCTRNWIRFRMPFENGFYPQSNLFLHSMIGRGTSRGESTKKRFISFSRDMSGSKEWKLNVVKWGNDAANIRMKSRTHNKSLIVQSLPSFPCSASNANILESPINHLSSNNLFNCWRLIRNWFATISGFIQSTRAGLSLLCSWIFWRFRFPAIADLWRCK